MQNAFVWEWKVFRVPRQNVNEREYVKAINHKFKSARSNALEIR